MTKVQEKERETRFDYLVWMKSTKREDFLAPRWREDNPANLKYGLFQFWVLVMPLLVRLGSEAQRPASQAMASCSGAGRGHEVMESGWGGNPAFLLGLALGQVAPFLPVAYPLSAMSKAIPVSQVRIHWDEREHISHVSGMY